MRLVFLGDIHANLPALEAVLRAVRPRPLDAVHHLGNVVGLGAQPMEVISRLQAEGIEGVRGNHDERIVSGAPLPVDCAADESQSLAEMVCDWTREVLPAGQRFWLGQQPFSRVISTGKMRVAFFNATPISMTLSPHEGQGDDFLREMHSYTRAHVNVFAHSHVPFWRVVDGNWFVNAGSVGFPAGDDGRACFASVDLNGGAAVRIERVAYDAAPAAAAIRAAGLPSGILRLLAAA